MKFVNSENANGHYTPAIISNGHIFISGQLSIDPLTKEVPGDDIKAHMKLALENFKRVLKSANADIEDVVMVRIYIPDIKYWSEVDEVYKEFFGSHKPARVVVPTRELHYGAKVEIEAVAEAND